MPTGVRVRAADERSADRAEAAGGEAIAEVRREAAPDQVVEPDLDLVVDGERGAGVRVEDGAGAGQQPQRPEVPLVRGAVRVGDVHEDHLRGDE